MKSPGFYAGASLEEEKSRTFFFCFDVTYTWFLTPLSLKPGMDHRLRFRTLMRLSGSSFSILTGMLTGFERVVLAAPTIQYTGNARARSTVKSRPVLDIATSDCW
jgi:hypothetical protein